MDRSVEQPLAPTLGGFAIAAPNARAASEISLPPIIKRWGTKEGLPHSAVIAMIQKGGLRS